MPEIIVKGVQGDQDLTKNAIPYSVWLRPVAIWYRQWSWLCSKSHFQVSLRIDVEIVYQIFGYLTKMREEQMYKEWR